MNKPDDLQIDDRWVKSHRGKKNPVDQRLPYATHLEPERAPDGQIEQIGTIFLTNKECPFQCLMCDLWKNTTDQSVQPGAIPHQIDWALNKLQGATSIKLYNSGNFFDAKAIPTTDYRAIADLLQNFNRVIVENHPKLINKHVLNFQQLLAPNLEMAMGLETIHPQVLSQLNKKMTLQDYQRAVLKLRDLGIPARAFILLRPPFLNESEGVVWAQKSIEYAFEIGVQTVAVIPTRRGNGALEHLETHGYFTPPILKSLEQVLRFGIGLKAGNVFADLWDLHLFSSCSKCLALRRERLQLMNLHQEIFPEIDCDCD